MCLRTALLTFCLALSILCSDARAQAIAGASPASVLLAKDGRAAMPIVLSAKASDGTKAVAAELAGYLRRMTDASFEITTGDGSAGIVLGTLADFPDPKLQEPLTIRDGFDGKEAYVIRTEPMRLRLIGAADLGTSHAAFRLLESLGCRWFLPGRTWEVFPRRPELTVSLNEISRPAILARRIWYGYGFFPDDASKAGAGRDARSATDYRDWARHNRMASSFTVSAGHAWQSIILHNRDVFAAHPEYLALTKGKRQGEQLCVSNAKVRELSIAHARDYLRKNPAADMVSMECSDGDGQCECDECRKLGTISDRVFGLANDVARVIAHEFPGKMVGVLAYNQHCEPPAFALEPNVYVQLTHGFIRGRYTFEELADLWPSKCKRMGFYEYFSVYLWDYDMLPGGVGANIGALKARIAAHTAHGATSIDAESGDNWGVYGRGYYLANKLMWDPKADAGVILDDFYQQAFGPGAPAMKRYYERFDPGNEPLMSESLLAEGFRDVQEAATRAGDRPDVRARLEDVKHYLRFVQLTWDLQREKDKELRKAGTLAVLRLVCRTRFSYMNHWQALRHELASKAAKEFGEPTWVLNDPSPKPWTDVQAYTAEETEKEFNEGLSRFRAEPVEQLTFSQNIVPVRFANAPHAVSDQRYQGAGRYALYSLQGEPLVFEIKTGIIAWYRDRAAAGYTITDGTGASIAQGRLAQDGEAHPLEIKVPRVGLYFLDFDDAGAGWGIKVAAGKPCAIVLPRGRAMSHMGHMQRMYFYVPKGTRDIRYYWLGGPHKCQAPDNRTVIDIATSGRFVSIPVPEGQDGKVWSLSQLALGHLWFFNVPNVLSASPDALLLPRELVEKDQLPAGQLRAQTADPSTVISDAKTDNSGILVHEVKSPFQVGTTQIRVLLPEKHDGSKSYPVVYILPVEKLNENRYGDGLLEVKKNDLHNKHQAIFVAPAFSRLPWYADHPANPEIRQETYLLNVVIPFIERTYPAQTRADGRLLLGFSKSGWGAFSLLLRHPILFGKAAAWDAPLMKDKPNQFGMGDIFGTQVSFEQYQITKLLEKQAGMLQDTPRLALLGYGNFRSHHQRAHELLMKLKIAHEYRDGPERKHEWSSGWVPEAVQFLLPAGRSQPVP